VTDAGPAPAAGAPSAVEASTTAARRVEKPWGFELIWVVTDRYVGKIIHIDAGRRLSLQRHVMKDEAIYVLSGRLRLSLEDDAGDVQVADLGPGEHRRVAAGRIHRYEAIETVELMEVSTPELDDVIRLEDDYGREGTSAP
jgi:mannose-6-phosphate isomerase-like protein (cupin superfamily)